MSKTSRIELGSTEIDHDHPRQTIQGLSMEVAEAIRQRDALQRRLDAVLALDPRPYSDDDKLRTYRDGIEDAQTAARGDL